MDIEITNEKENILLDRKEITFNILHTDATPSRDQVKNKLVALLNSRYELVVVDKLATQYGTQKTIGYAKVYSDAERASKIENKSILERNKPVEVVEEPGEPAAESTTEEPAAESTTKEPAAESSTEEPAAESTIEEPAAESTIEEPAAESTTEEPVEEASAEESTEPKE